VIPSKPKGLYGPELAMKEGQTVRRLTTIMVGVIMVGAGLLGFAENRIATPLLEVTRQIGQGEPLTSDYLDRNQKRFFWPVLSSICLPGQQRAAVIFWLTALDTRTVEEQAGSLSAQQQTDATFVGTIEALRNLLVCAPTDGNAWLRLAMVLNGVEGPSSRVIAAIERSFWMAPNEAWIVRVRLIFLAKLINAGVADDRVTRIFDTDVLTMALAGSGREVRDFAAAGGALARNALRRAISLIDPRRGALILDAMGG